MSLPSTKKEMRLIFEDVMAGLGLERTGPPRPFYASRYTGTLEGLWLVTDAKFAAILGAASCHLITVVSLSPELGLGLELSSGQDAEFRDDAYLPETWRSRDVEGVVDDVTSYDPQYTREVLGSVPRPQPTWIGQPTGRGVHLTALRDGQADFVAMGVVDGRGIRRHIEQSVRWSRQLVDAAQSFEPKSHEAFPQEVWRGIVRDRGGRLELAERSYVQAQHEGELRLRARWLRRVGYDLVGQLSWPALDFEHLSLEVTAARSWLRRLFLKDIEVGDAAFDEAFIIDARPEESLSRLLTSGVRKAALELASVSQELRVDIGGVRFVVGPPDARDALATEAVEAASALLKSIAATRDPTGGAYR